MTDMQRTTDQVSTLSQRDRNRIYAVLCRTLYLPRVPKPETITVDTLVDTLYALAESLREHSDACRERNEELGRHRELIRGGRRLLVELLPKADQTDR